MTDLSTSYLGLKLKNPVIVSSSDLTSSVSKIKECEEAGAGAVVLKSIFEEQFLIDGNIPDRDYTIHPESLDYLRSGGLLEYGPHAFVEMITQVKREVDFPIIASINCQTSSLWPNFAKQLQEAGADALELNIFLLPIDLHSSGEQQEEYHLQVLKEVKKVVSIPVSIKLTSQITSIPYLANRLAEQGCDGLVLFNWFLEPDINVNTLKTRSMIGKGNLRQSIRWVGLLSGRVSCDIVSSGGVREPEDLVKLILAGASAVQVCTLLYQKGIDEIKNLLKGLESWMEKSQNNSIEDFKGEMSFKKQDLSHKDVGEAISYFRSQYLKTYLKR